MPTKIKPKIQPNKKDEHKVVVRDKATGIRAVISIPEDICSKELTEEAAETMADAMRLVIDAAAHAVGACNCDD